MEQPICIIVFFDKTGQMNSAVAHCRYIRRLDSTVHSTKAFQINPYVEEGHPFGVPPVLILTSHDFGASRRDPPVELAQIDLNALGKELADAAKFGEIADHLYTVVSSQTQREASAEPDNAASSSLFRVIVQAI